MFSKLKYVNLIFILFVIGCNKDVTIIGNKVESSWFVPNTVVLNKTVQYANGVSQGVIKLQVFTKDNQPIPGLFMNGTSATNTTNFVSCSQSNSQGIVWCRFTATVSGTTDIELTDGGVSFDTDIVFIDLPTKLSYTKVSSSQISKQTNLGITSYTGVGKSNWVRTSPGGAKINTEATILRLNLTTPHP